MSRYAVAEAIQSIPDYSQDHEQEHILAACESITKGRYLDIGAFHPTELSNTRALWELGWSGVMVEPSPAPMLSLLKEYGTSHRVQLVSAVITPGESGGLSNMSINNGPYSTIDLSNYQKFHRFVDYSGNVLIPIVPLAALISSLGPFDFIDIDVEGGSSELFYRMLDLGSSRPKCVCVEYDNHRAEIERRAEASGYERIFVNATNIIFARRSMVMN